MKLELLPRTDLAVRAIRFFALNPGANSAEAAGHLDTSHGYLTQVLRPLVGAGFLATSRGPNGGYRVTEAGEAMSMLAAIECMEGPTDDGRCVLRGSQCDADHPCALHDAWTEARTALTDHLAAVPVTARVPKEQPC